MANDYAYSNQYYEDLYNKAGMWDVPGSVRKEGEVLIPDGFWNTPQGTYSYGSNPNKSYGKIAQWDNPNSWWDPSDWILKPDWMQHTGRTGDDRFRQNTMGGRGRYRGGVNPRGGHRSKPLDFSRGPSIWNFA